MSPRPDVSKERKSQILDAAEDIFTEKGFDSARMEDIADQTGLSKGTLYLYFEGKNDLIVALLDRVFQKEFDRIRNLINVDSTSSEKMMAITGLVIDDMKGMLGLIPILYNFLALAFRNKHVQAALKNYLHHYLDVLIPIIREGIDRGEFKDIEPQDIAINCMAILEGTLLLWVYDRNTIDIDRHIRLGMENLIRGLKHET